ncbi:MAG TPA: sensor histidine kinase [Thermoleophilaceae bacterium]|nr:sensor histidine kinase [Thermoleophilaceae bacterium]
MSHWFGAFWPGARSAPGHRLFCASVALVFLAYPLADLVSGRLAGVGAVTAAAGLAAFAALYLRLFWILPWVGHERRTEGLLLLGAIAVLAVALAVRLENDWVALLVYLSVAAALTLPMRLAVPGVLAAAAAAAAIVGRDEPVVVQAMIFGLLVLAVRRLSGLVEELAAARARVAELAVSEERLRLSRDLHDLLGHNLSVIALKAELARRLIDRHEPAAAAEEMRDVESVARESLQEAREAVRGLRRGRLSAELDRAREALEAASIEATVRPDGPLPGELEGILGFAVREATTNVIRHSGAHRCELSVRSTGDTVELEVRDDGVGARENDGDGSGLRGLGERLATVGGTLTAGSAPSGGFHLVARVPLTRRLAPR